MRIERYDEVASRIRSLADGVTFIAVDAGGGAGKSTFSDRLAAGLDAATVAMDDFGSFEDLYDVDRLLNEAIEPLAAGRAARYRAWDWWRRELREERDIPPNPFVVLEGISSGRVELRPFVSFLVWIDCPPDIRLKRGLERDGPDALSIWERWMRWEDEYAAREHPRERADLIVDGAPTLPHEPENEFVALDLEELRTISSGEASE